MTVHNIKPCERPKSRALYNELFQTIQKFYNDNTVTPAEVLGVIDIISKEFYTAVFLEDVDPDEVA